MVNKFIERHPLEENLAKNKIRETAIYNLIRRIPDHSEDNSTIAEYFEHPQMKEYFSSRNNIRLLNDLVEAMIQSSEVWIERAIQMDFIYILGADSIENALKRNSQQIGKLTNLVNTGFNYLLSPPYGLGNDMEIFNEFSPILKRWKDHIDAREVAEKFFKGLDNELTRGDYEPELIYTMVRYLTELTDRETVSMLAYHGCRDKTYSDLVDDGIIEPFSISDESVELANIHRAIRNYEDGTYSFEEFVEELGEVDNNVKGLIAERMASWFTQGNIGLITRLVNYNEGKLYDLDTARASIGKEIESACSEGDYKRLDSVMRLPKELLDENNPNIADVVEAYDIIHGK